MQKTPSTISPGLKTIVSTAFDNEEEKYSNHKLQPFQEMITAFDNEEEKYSNHKLQPFHEMITGKVSSNFPQTFGWLNAACSFLSVYYIYNTLRSSDNKYLKARCT